MRVEGGEQVMEAQLFSRRCSKTLTALLLEAGHHSEDMFCSMKGDSIVIDDGNHGIDPTKVHGHLYDGVANGSDYLDYLFVETAAHYLRLPHLHPHDALPLVVEWCLHSAHLACGMDLRVSAVDKFSVVLASGAWFVWCHPERTLRQFNN